MTQNIQLTLLRHYVILNVKSKENMKFMSRYLATPSAVVNVVM